MNTERVLYKKKEKFKKEKYLRKSFDSILRKEKRLKTFIEGHRGTNRVNPENTIISFKTAIEYGIDSIELDIWLTKDKVPVVIHGGDDGEIKNFTNCHGKVNDLTFNEISKIRTIKFNQSIPRLEEVLELCKDKIFLNIELKDFQVKETFKIVIEALEKYDMLNQFAFSSFNHSYYEEVKNFSERFQEIEFGFLYSSSYKHKLRIDEYKFVPKTTMNVYQRRVSKKLVDKAHQHEMGVMAWFKMSDKEKDEDYERLFRAGVDVICSNVPNLALNYRELRGII